LAYVDAEGVVFGESRTGRGRS